MSANAILSRLRQFLLGLTGCLFVGTLVELVFTGHTQEPVQLIPFVRIRPTGRQCGVDSATAQDPARLARLHEPGGAGQPLRAV